MEKYGIYHVYDAETTMGDPVKKRDLIAVCDDKTIAEQYAQRFDKTRMYRNNGIAPLYEGTLEVVDMSNIIVVTAANAEQSPWDRVSWWERDALADYIKEPDPVTKKKTKAAPLTTNVGDLLKKAGIMMA